jgi:hypothetical protein
MWDPFALNAARAVSGLEACRRPIADPWTGKRDTAQLAADLDRICRVLAELLERLRTPDGAEQVGACIVELAQLMGRAHIGRTAAGAVAVTVARRVLEWRRMSEMGASQLGLPADRSEWGAVTSQMAALGAAIRENRDEVNTAAVIEWLKKVAWMANITALLRE